MPVSIFYHSDFLKHNTGKDHPENKKRLLAKGVPRVEGQFEIKDLLEICNFEGVRIGVGRAGCNAKELRHQIKEHKLTNKGGKGILSKPVIHRNHLFLE